MVKSYSDPESGDPFSSESLGGPWPIPTGENDIEGMIELQLRAFRETNAFPTDSPLTIEQKRAIVKELPAIGTPGATMGRLAVYAHGDMLSLDLGRTRNEGSWQVGRELDEEVEGYLRQLFADEGEQRRMGVVALGNVIDKTDAGAEPTSHATSLSEALDREGIFQVTRQRTVARLALRESGVACVIRKRSDFEIRTLDAPDDELQLRASAIAHGGFNFPFAQTIDRNVGIAQLELMNRQLRSGFNAIIETAIRENAAYMEPYSMGYHVARKSSSKKRA